MAGRLRPLPARRPLHRHPLYPGRQAPGAGLRPQLEDDQSRRGGPRPGPLPGGAGLAGTPGAQAAGESVKIATTSSGGGPDGSTLQLSIQCRGGRTDLMIGGPALTRRGEDYVVSYAVNDGQPVVVAAGTPASGTGLAIRGDVVRLLASLPDRGEVAFRVTTRQGAALEGRYALAGLKIVLGRLAVPCKWPAAAAPRNRGTGRAMGRLG